MEFFDEFEIIGGMIPNLVGLAFFCGVIIYFDQTRKAKVRRNGWFKPYEVSIEGKTYLDLHPRGHSPLDVHLQGILQWRPSNPIRKMNYMDA